MYTLSYNNAFTLQLIHIQGVYAFKYQHTAVVTSLCGHHEVSHGGDDWKQQCSRKFGAGAKAFIG